MSDPRTAKTYIVDTNILIGFSTWIPVEINNVFWSFLEESLRDGKWVLLDVVVKEIIFNSSLKDWCKNQNKNGLVKSITVDDRRRGIEINKTYEMIDQVTMNSETDTYLVAYAERNGLTVLSREIFKTSANKLYKIPDVCGFLKVVCSKQPKEFLKAIGFNN
jgi:hypothetical protein